MSNKIPLFLIFILCSLFQSCNNNPEYVPDVPIEICKIFPIIENIEYKENPIVSSQIYQNRTIILTSTDDLDKLPQSYIIENPELKQIDFDKYSLVVTSIITDEDVIDFSPQMFYNITDRNFSILIKLHTSLCRHNPAEWVFIFSCSQTNITKYTTTYSLANTNKETEF